MKQLAVVFAAILTLALVAPAMAQPFADVPTDHWAYDAIAELAAKGLIEGYPDGSFKGDRAMTRYEMAMVVARLLARIEAIKIPPLPTDLVRTPQLNAANAANTAAIRALDQRLTAKLATVQRLVAEFRAELAALGVRVTAVEEELAAIRARLDNTRVTGDLRFRYNTYPSGSVSGGGTNRAPDVRMRARLTFTGRVAPNVEAVIRLWAANNANQSTAFDTRFGNMIQFGNVSFDYLYLDVRGVLYGNWRFGRQPYSLAPYGWGGGLLFDPFNSTGTGSAGLYTPFVSTSGMADGVKAQWGLGPINLEVALFQESTAGNFATPGTTEPPFPTGLGGAPDRQYRVVRGTTGALLPGWTLGVSWYEQGASPYLPAGGFIGGTGWGVDINGTIIPGLTVYADYASWRPRLDPGNVFSWGTMSAWRIGGNLNLATIAGIAMWNPNIDFEYHNYGGPNFDPVFGFSPPPKYSYATTAFGQAFDWNMRGWAVGLNLTFTPRWSAFARYEGGNRITDGASYSEWWLRLTHVLAPRTNVYIQYTRGTVAGADYFNFYRAEMTTSW